MKTLSIILLMLALNFFSMAQQPGKVVETIKGKVINATTNEPVSYTNIGLEGTFFGTASDSDGNFELKIPQELVSKNIFFSAVGFKNKQFPVESLFDKEFNMVKMEAQSYGIDNIDVAAQNMVLIRILRMASENIPYNFIQGPYNLIGEYISEKTIDNATLEQKAEVLIYDKNGYANPSKKDAFQSLKYTIEKENAGKDYSFSSGSTNLDELLNFDWVRSATSILNPALTADFQLILESEPKIENRSYWVIFFKQKKPSLAGSGDFYATEFEGKITVNKEDYSVLRIEGKSNSPKNNRQGKSLAIGKENVEYFKNVSSDFSIQYESLKPSKIVLTKSYLRKGEKITERSSLEISQVKATGITRLNSRQYYTGK